MSFIRYVGFFFFGWVFVMPTLLVMPEIIEKFFNDYIYEIEFNNLDNEKSFIANENWPCGPCVILTFI